MRRRENRKGSKIHTAFCGVIQVLSGPHDKGGKHPFDPLQLPPAEIPAHLEGKDETRRRREREVQGDRRIRNNPKM